MFYSFPKFTDLLRPCLSFHIIEKLWSPEAFVGKLNHFCLRNKSFSSKWRFTRFPTIIFFQNSSHFLTSLFEINSWLRLEIFKHNKKLLRASPISNRFWACLRQGFKSRENFLKSLQLTLFYSILVFVHRYLKPFWLFHVFDQCTEKVPLCLSITKNSHKIKCNRNSLIVAIIYVCF